MRLFLIRHADPDYPNNTITAAGHLEAAALSRRMARMGLDRIYVSPLGRALHTMQYTADALKMEAVIEPWTAELGWPGIDQEVLGNSMAWDVHGHTLRLSKTEFTRSNWNQIPPLDRPEFLEGFQKVQTASDQFFSNLGYHREEEGYRITRGNREKIALFCHGGFGLTLLAHLLDIPLPLMWGGFFLPPSSVTTVLFDERGPQFAVPRCLGVGDISHLYAEQLPMQPSGIKNNVE
jgi:probable phosphoglycerate mutase